MCLEGKRVNLPFWNFPIFFATQFLKKFVHIAFCLKKFEKETFHVQVKLWSFFRDKPPFLLTDRACLLIGVSIRQFKNTPNARK